MARSPAPRPQSMGELADRAARAGRRLGDEHAPAARRARRRARRDSPLLTGIVPAVLRVAALGGCRGGRWPSAPAGLVLLAGLVVDRRPPTAAARPRAQEQLAPGRAAPAP